MPSGPWRRRAAEFGGVLNSLLRRIQDSWRTSMQVRVVGSITAATALVMVLLGFGLAVIFGQSMFQTRIDMANNEIDRARIVIEERIEATASSGSIQTQLDAARAALAQELQTGRNNSGLYDAVLVVPDHDGATVSSPEGYHVPRPLTDMVASGVVAYQFIDTERADGTTFASLHIGTPTATEIPGLQLYLVMSLDAEAQTMQTVDTMLAFAACVMVALLGSIMWFMTIQITGPVRAAALVAQRLAAGHLRERMEIRGEDEMARLALSFNDMADKLSTQIEQLEEYGELQHQFTSAVSHELRTPLTSMRMAAEILADESDDLSAAGKVASKRMLQDLDSFESLLIDLLEIARFDEQRAVLNDEQTDLSQCVRTAWTQSRTLAANLGVEVLFDLPEEPVWFSGEATRVERVIRNLVNNAIDHSEGNPVTIAVAGNDTSVAVTVTDHGVGLKAGAEELVFDRFWRADPSRTRHSGGTGLGLAIALEDARLHGGTLEVASTFGVGSQFRLVLPRTPNAKIHTPALPLAAPEPLKEDTP
ncbi:MtrAB system histidine kinase MtrB [Corynebacterium uterequi]|uniref:Sensor histidine kinase MtrB n=1 Tax=Corynebacterium uterequi TaxID=1072256 RepID=A0A0G3HAX9_9CORY|nr:MtrAB system histidine kinase MtrB [Corynebacterium uterequi]AKK10526.1 signal transduction histidine kinase [Corynebacterium uterequi]